jgi:hypothetical protein
MLEVLIVADLPTADLSSTNVPSSLTSSRIRPVCLPLLLVPPTIFITPTPPIAPTIPIVPITLTEPEIFVDVVAGDGSIRYGSDEMKIAHHLRVLPRRAVGHRGR